MIRCFGFHFFSGLLLPLVCAVTAQEDGGWRKELVAFEELQARRLLPVQQILFSELSAREQMATKGSDRRLQAELEARVAVAKMENDLLKKGRVPQTSWEDDQKKAVLVAASGQQWRLSGTERVKRVGLRRGGIRSFSEEGLELGDLAVDHLAPGVFGSKRRQDSGWTCFTFSADLRASQCLIVSEILEGVRFPMNQARPVPEVEGVLPRGGALVEPMDLLALLETRYRQRLLECEAARRVLIEDLMRSPTIALGDLSELRRLLLRALAAHELLLRPASSPGLEMETPETFLGRLRGSEWQIEDVPALSRLRFDGLIVHSLAESGQVRETLAATLEWPGLVRLKPAGAVPLLLVFGPDLERVIVLPVRSVFPGRLVEE